MMAVKATLDAAGLQCLEVEAATSKQVSKGLQLDHKTGVLSLEASRIWRLRRGLEYAARQRHLTGDQVAKLIGHITWSCLLRRPALSLINAGYRFARAFGPRSGRLWPAVTQELRWISSLLPLLSCNLASPWSPWVYATDASGGTHGGYEVTRRLCDPVHTTAAGSCAERRRFSAEEFISARRSAWASMSGKCRKPVGLGSKTHTKFVVLTCILLCLETCGRISTQRPMIALSSKLCRHPYFNPSLPGASCLEVSGGNHWISCGERAKPIGTASCLSVSLKVGKRFLFLLDNMALVCPESQPHVSRGLSRLSCHVHHPCLQMDRV